MGRIRPNQAVPVTVKGRQCVKPIQARIPGWAQDRILRRLNRKERKERRDSGQKGRGLALAAGRVLRPGQLAHLELIGAEVDEQTMFETGGLQVTKNLSHMLVGQSFGSF